MAWMDVPLPECLAFGTTSQTNWLTLVQDSISGYEERTQAHTRVRMTFDLTWAVKDENDFRELRDHHTMARGKLNTFGVTDFADYEIVYDESLFQYVAPGIFQLHKKYGVAPFRYDRKITRVVPGEFAAERWNGSAWVAMVAGSGPGQYAMNVNTGLLSVQADQTRSVTSHVPGTTHRFNVSSDFSPNVAPGGTVYASGVGGTAASLLNGLPLTVAAVGAGFVTVSVNTTALTATDGTLARRVAAVDLRAQAEFMVPVRYSSDSLAGIGIDRAGDTLLIRTSGIGLVEDLE